MATLTVSVNSVAKSSGDVIVLPDSTTASPPADLTISLAASGGSVNIRSVANAVWGRRLQIKSGSPVNFTASPGTTYSTPFTITTSQSLTFGAVTIGSAHNVHEIGGFYTQLTIKYDLGDSVVRTFTLVFVGIMGAAGSDLSLTLDELKSRVIHGFSLGSSDPSEDNPVGLGWGIKDNGHLVFAQTYAAPIVAAGFPNQFWHQVTGQLHLLTGESDIVFDNFAVAASYPEEEVPSLWYSHFDEAVNYFAGLSGAGTLYCYTGSPRRNARFLALLAAGDAFGVIQWFWGAVSPYLKHPVVTLCVDVPYLSSLEGINPATDEGESRYELLKAFSQIQAEDRDVLLTEPRGSDVDTQWYAPTFGRCIVEHTWQRNNPTFYSDAAGATTDAHINGSTVLRWHIDGTVDTLPYQIADTLRGYASNANHKCIIGLRDFVLGGGTPSSLLTLVNALVAKMSVVTP